MVSSMKAATHIIQGIGWISSCPKITHFDTCFSGSSLRPYLLSKRSASTELQVLIWWNSNGINDGKWIRKYEENANLLAWKECWGKNNGCTWTPVVVKPWDTWKPAFLSTIGLGTSGSLLHMFNRSEVESWVHASGVMLVEAKLTRKKTKRTMNKKMQWYIRQSNRK